MKNRYDNPAFTLIELLVVVAIISLLVSILLPSLSTAKDLARKAACKMSIRCLQLGNLQYEQDNGGFFAPAASGGKNLCRWFGQRLTAKPNETPFNISNGPLLSYLSGQAVRDCPSFKDFDSGFETGCGGFGYNQVFVGSYIKLTGQDASGKVAYEAVSADSGNAAESFVAPDATVAFTDTAFAKNGGIIEYSFCEPPRDNNLTTHRPSIHFRHIGRANVTWLDSHVSDEELTFSNNSAGASYGYTKPIDFNIGFFGENNYSLFDLE